MVIFAYILTALAAYLLGSIPTGFLVGKARGIDLRKAGSGNIGATNAFRQLGTFAGILVLFVDALKGWVAVMGTLVICHWLWPSAKDLEREWLEIVAAFLAIVGHNYTCWLWFKGGKGIATSAGVLLALVPGPLAIILTIWIILFFLTRYVSLASICASFTLPFAVWLTGRSEKLILITSAMAALAIYKHRSNIQRLLNGTESRLARKQPAGAVTTQR